MTLNTTVPSLSLDYSASSSMTPQAKVRVRGLESLGSQFGCLILPLGEATKTSVSSGMAFETGNQALGLLLELLHRKGLIWILRLWAGTISFQG